MNRTSFLVGISTIALAAGGASAQTTTNGDTTNPSTGNRIVVSCTTASGNVCSVNQGAVGATFNSTGSVNATGTNNTSTVDQTGNRQYAENRATGDRNSAVATQRGFNNSSSISQTGSTTTGATANSATVSQGGSAAAANNNVAQVVQVRTAGAANAAGVNAATVTQGTQTAGGFNNTAVTTQNGTALTSTITQDETGGGAVVASNNSATVSQLSSAGASSTVTQSRSGNVASVSMFGGNNTANTAPAPVTGANISSVTQTNTAFQSGSTAGSFIAGAPSSNANSPSTGNVVNVAITGLQNNSTVSQNGVQNSAEQSMLNGGAGNTSAANATGTNPGTGAAFPANRPEGNSSTITQTGRGNYAATSIGGRVTPGGGAGNVSTISQSQSDAAVTATTLTSAQSATTAHRALVYQRGVLDSVSIGQTNNNLGSGTPGTTVQSGSLADVAQLSFNSFTTVNQTGTNTARVTQGSRTETTGADNGLFISQIDAGDITSTTTTPGQGGGFGGTGGSTSTNVTESRNTVDVAQYGIQNSATIQQNAINASGSLFQAVGTRTNRARIDQGSGTTYASTSAEQVTATQAAANTGSNARNLVAVVNQTAGTAGFGNQTGTNVAPANGTITRGALVSQSGQNLTARADQQGGTATAGTGTQTLSNNAIAIVQAYSNSSATVSQNGTNLSAAVEQRGINTDATRLNLVTVSQTGDNNAARATQTQNAGASASTSTAVSGVPNDVNFPFSRSGANSAEIVISQSGTGGSATVEQRGKGQYASITQSGTNNVGGILQDVGAENAVAVLTQSGTNNTYYITQTTAGQYIRVSQTGTTNTASIINGPSGPGNNGAATPQTPPTFGGVQ